ncbi:MAG: hypothetical protein AAB250_02440, partial [Bdellovibrionota bacterium]
EWFEYLMNRRSQLDPTDYAALFELPHWDRNPVLLRMQVLTKADRSQFVDRQKLEAAMSNPHFRRVADFKVAEGKTPMTSVFRETISVRLARTKAFFQRAPRTCPQVFGAP